MISIDVIQRSVQMLLPDLDGSYWVISFHENTQKQKNLFILPIIEEYQYTTLKYQHWLLASIYTVHQDTYQEYWNARKNIMNEWGGDTQLIPKESELTYLTR